MYPPIVSQQHPQHYTTGVHHPNQKTETPPPQRTKQKQTKSTPLKNRNKIKRTKKSLNQAKKKKKIRNNWSLCPPSSPDHNPLDCAIWDTLENKTNATSHPNIVSLKTAIEEEWNKMSEEFILKECKSFRRRVDTIIEKKNGGHIE